MNSVVHNQDCLEAMKQMPDKAFDLAVADPPYGLDIMHGGGQPRHLDFLSWERKDWDIATPDAEYFAELRRVSLNQIVWGGNYFTDNLPPTQGWIIWDKMSRDFTFADFEMAWCSFDRAARAFNMSRASAYTHQLKIHPTQKPVALYKWLLTNYAEPGQTILDTHMGSQSSRIAAYDLGFSYVGYEIDEDYFKAGCERFETHCRQPKLFSPQEQIPVQGAMFAAA